MFEWGKVLLGTPPTSFWTSSASFSFSFLFCFASKLSPNSALIPPPLSKLFTDACHSRVGRTPLYLHQRRQIMDFTSMHAQRCRSGYAHSPVHTHLVFYHMWFGQSAHKFLKGFFLQSPFRTVSTPCCSKGTGRC